LTAISSALPASTAAFNRADPPAPDGGPLLPAPNNGPLTVALALSLVFHSVLLLITFQFPDVLSSKSVPGPIEVVLVNSKSAARPLKADALAQHNLDGGGNTEANRRAKTNLPALPDMPADAQLSLASKRVQQLEIEAHHLLTQLRAGQDAIDPRTLPIDQVTPSDAPKIADLPHDRLEIARLEAQIAREWEAYQKLPKRKFVGARTESAVEAEYLDAWRQRIERVGTENFPDEARRLGVFGTVMVTVAIRADGTVEKIEIDRSSGLRILDVSVERIVQLAGPFRPFPAALRKRADILHITRNWAFTRSDLLITTEN
jgi:periplasmic protein TonB